MPRHVDRPIRQRLPDFLLEISTASRSPGLPNIWNVVPRRASGTVSPLSVPGATSMNTSNGLRSSPAKMMATASIGDDSLAAAMSRWTSVTAVADTVVGVSPGGVTLSAGLFGTRLHLTALSRAAWSTEWNALLILHPGNASRVEGLLSTTGQFCRPPVGSYLTAAGDFLVGHRQRRHTAVFRL